MVRIICFENNHTLAANVGGPIRVTHKTFDVALPEVEAWLSEQVKYGERGFVGIEIVADIPAGWKAVAYREPRFDEYFLSDGGRIGYQDGKVSFHGRRAEQVIVVRDETGTAVKEPRP